MKKSTLAILITTLLLGGCFHDGDDGKDGADGIIPSVVNEAPNTIPSLKFWQGKTGFTDITDTSRIILNSDDAEILEVLQGTANIFNEDLKVLNGFTLDVVLNGGEGKKGDIIYNITGFTPPAHDKSAHDESYTVSIDGKVVITAPEIRGAAYASATIKQMLAQDSDGNDSLSNGLIQDEPKMRVRGFMLDMGRRGVDKQFLTNYLKFMSYYKMSELQMHINDNKILKGHPDDPNTFHELNWSWDSWDTEYVSFSLQLQDTENWELSKISNKEDPSKFLFVLSVQDMKELRTLADSLGIELTLEVEAPAHAGAFTQAFPELKNPDHKPDHLDLSNPKTFDMLKDVWTQLIPYFHNAHIGMDEYAGDPKDHTMPDKTSGEMVNYMNTMNAFLKDKGFNEIRAWGNYGQLAFPNREELDSDIVYQPWWGQPAMAQQAYDAGHKFINTNHIWYTVPTSAGACYPDMHDPKNLYDNYRADIMSGWERDVGAWGKEYPMKMNVNDPQFLGATVAIWNDNGHYEDYYYSDQDVHERLRNKLKIVAENMWNNKTTLPYEEFMNLAGKLGESPSFKLAAEFSPLYEGNLVGNASAYSSSYKMVTVKPENCNGGIEGVNMTDLTTTNYIGHASAAIDGETNSRWIAQDKDGSTAWLSVDLQTPQAIGKVSIDWGKGWASEYLIQTSDDGFAWKTVATVEGSGIKDDTVNFESVTARFVKMQGVTMGSDKPYQIHEFRVFAK